MRSAVFQTIAIVLAQAAIPSAEQSLQEAGEPDFGAECPSAPDRSNYATPFRQALDLGNLDEAIRIQRQRIRQLDCNAPYVLLSRARLRRELGLLLLDTQACDDAIGWFTSARAVLQVEPASDLTTIVSEWNEERLWANLGMIRAYRCLGHPDFAENRVHFSRLLFTQAPYAPLIKALVEAEYADLLAERRELAAAREAIDRALVLIVEGAEAGWIDENTRLNLVGRFRTARARYSSRGSN